MNNKKLVASLGGIIIALGIYFLMFYTMSPFGMTMTQASNRLVYAAQCMVFPFFILLLACYNVVCHGYAHSHPDGVDSQGSIKRMAARHFVEMGFFHIFVFFGLILMLATYLSPFGMRLVPAMVTIFSFALMMIWIGHTHDDAESCKDWKNTFGLSIILLMTLCLSVTDIVFFFMDN